MIIHLLCDFGNVNVEDADVDFIIFIRNCYCWRPMGANPLTPPNLCALI